MWRAGVASACLALLAWLASAWVTHDFRVWTAEGARRLEITEQPVRAPAVIVEGPDLKAQTLSHLLSADRSATIVDFIYTRCPSVCSVLGGGYQQLQNAIRADASTGHVAGKVRLLSISFDPVHDDAQALQAYANRLRADPNVWRIARVRDTAALRTLLERFRVVVIPDGRGDFEHNAALLVVDANGRLVRIFDYDRLEDALLFARRLTQREAPA